MKEITGKFQEKNQSLPTTIETENGIIQKEPPKGVLRKMCSENMQQIYKKTPMLKCDVNKVAIAGEFNTSFRNIGPNLANKIRQVKISIFI